MKQISNIFRSRKLLQIQVFVVLLSTIISCNFNDPSIEILANYNFSYYNNNPVAVGGEYLKDSIYVQVYSYTTPTDVSGFTVEFKIKNGGGTVDKQVVKTKKDGKASTRWKLGTDSFTQIVTARVTDPNGNVFPEAQIVARGLLYNAWNEVNYYPLNQLSDMASDTITHQSWMISASKVYKRGDNFLDWQQVDESKLNGGREIEIDKNGVVYIGTWNGELVKSTDHGLNWIKCTKPIPDNPYFFYLWITNDGDLWATRYDRGLWHSIDGGITWSNPLAVTGETFTMNGAYRLKNGWLVSMVNFGLLKMEIMKSEDEGKTWNPISTTAPEYPYSVYVTGKDEIIIFTQSIAGIFKSTDLGKTYRKVFEGSVTFNTSAMQSYVKKFGMDYYIAIPGHGVLQTQDFEKFETLFTEPNIDGLYIDHTGSIAVMGWLDKLNTSFFYGRK